MSAGTVVPRTASELVDRFGNEMGWDPFEVAQRDGKEVWQVRAFEAGKLNRAMKRNPNITLETLTLTLEWCKAKGITIRTPYGLTYKVDDMLLDLRRDTCSQEAAAARAAQSTEDAADLERLVEDAVMKERLSSDVERFEWLGRFARAQGPARRTVYDEWKAAGRG